MAHEYRQLDLNGLSLDDSDLELILQASAAKAAAHHISVRSFAEIISDINNFGQIHGLRFGAAAVNKALTDELDAVYGNE